MAGSFAGAAKLLNVSTSHISRAVARLENAVGAPVFARSTRRVALTDTGRVLVDHFRRIIQERDDALASVSDGGEPRGEVRMTCSTALGERFVAPIVRGFMRDHPQISISFELTNRVVDLVAEGFDLAIRTGILSDSRLVGTRIGSRRLHTCASPAYLERAGNPATVEDLASHDCLIGTGPVWHFQVGGKDRAYRPKGRWRCNSGEAVVGAALEGMGVCQLPEFYLTRHLDAGRLVPVLKDFRVDDEPIWAVYPQRRHLLPKVRLLVDRLRRDLTPALATPGQ
jgi:DNA-binding transcriptional LysR family regulator